MDIEEIVPLALRVREDCAERALPEDRTRVLSVGLELSDRLTVSAGMAIPSKNVVRLSVAIYTNPANADDAVADLDDTVRHEIAHLLVPGCGHGDRWRCKYLRLGGRRKGCYHNLAVRRRPRAPVWCSRCGAFAGTYAESRVGWAARNLVTRCCRAPLSSTPPGPQQLEMFS